MADCSYQAKRAADSMLRQGRIKELHELTLDLI